MFDACQPGREGLERGEAVMLGRQQSQEDVAVARVVREQDRAEPIASQLAHELEAVVERDRPAPGA